jgi:2-polyprenyl-3-methyl-5-hydroxy-6-metoxy-1,4-benzoquinol methylase
LKKIGNYMVDCATDKEISALRPEHRYILDLVKSGSHVLDLGCGEGDLLKAVIAKDLRKIEVKYGKLIKAQALLSKAVLEQLK